MTTLGNKRLLSRKDSERDVDMYLLLLLYFQRKVVNEQHYKLVTWIVELVNFIILIDW